VKIEQSGVYLTYRPGYYMNLPGEASALLAPAAEWDTANGAPQRDERMGHASLRSMEPYQHQEIDQLLDAVNQRNTDRTPPNRRCLIRAHFWTH
jgi:hypothetical protein